MGAIDFGNTRRQASETANLVEQLATRMNSIAGAVGASGPGFADLACAGDALAGLARTAAQQIDGCLALASRHSHPGASAELAIAGAELAMNLTTALDNTLNATVTIYAQACAKLADHACVVEELDTLPAACEQRLSAVTLAARARSLTTRVMR
jgi:hypothetical protein